MGGIKEILERDLGRDVPVRVTGRVGRLTLSLRRTAPGRSREGNEAGGEATGEDGEESPSARGRGESLHKVPYARGTVAEENPTRRNSYQVGLQCTQESLEKGRTVTRTRAPD